MNTNAEHKRINVGYKWQSANEVRNFEYYFGLYCIKRFARDRLDLESEINCKYNKKMIFNKEDKLYQEANNIYHICSK